MRKQREGSKHIAIPQACVSSLKQLSSIKEEGVKGRSGRLQILCLCKSRYVLASNASFFDTILYKIHQVPAKGGRYLYALPVCLTLLMHNGLAGSRGSCSLNC